MTPRPSRILSLTTRFPLSAKAVAMAVAMAMARFDKLNSQFGKRHSSRSYSTAVVVAVAFGT